MRIEDAIQESAHRPPAHDLKSSFAESVPIVRSTFIMWPRQETDKQ
jgi:hypothetical protein